MNSADATKEQIPSGGTTTDKTVDVQAKDLNK